MARNNSNKQAATNENLAATEPVSNTTENTSEPTTTPVKLVDLIVKIAFTDKYDESKKYEIGDVIEADSISKERYDELLHDKRGIVAENK